MSKKPYVVVAGTDFSENAVRALRVASAQALLHTPAELHVVHASILASAAFGAATAVPMGFATLPLPSLEEQRQALGAHLDAQRAQLPGVTESKVRVFGHVILENPTVAIEHLAAELAADLIVVGSHGYHGVRRWLLGSVAEGVVRSAHCPVLVVPPPVEQFKVPTIDPPCPRCVEARAASNGAQTWCEQHRERHGRRHTYYQSDRLGTDSNMPLVVR